MDQAADLDCQSSSRGSGALRVKGGVALPQVCRLQDIATLPIYEEAPCVEVHLVAWSLEVQSHCGVDDMVEQRTLGGSPSSGQIRERAGWTEGSVSNPLVTNILSLSGPTKEGPCVHLHQGGVEVRWASKDPLCQSQGLKTEHTLPERT